MVTQMTPLRWKTKTAFYIDGSVYRPCGSMHGGMQHGSVSIPEVAALACSL